MHDGMHADLCISGRTRLIMNMRLSEACACICATTSFVCVCVARLASLCSDSHYCGLRFVFKAHPQTTDLSCPAVLVFLPSPIPSLFSLAICFCWRIQTQKNKLVFFFTPLPLGYCFKHQRCPRCVVHCKNSLGETHICTCLKTSW